MFLKKPGSRGPFQRCEDHWFKVKVSRKRFISVRRYPSIWNPSPNLRPRPAASVDEHFNVSVTEIQKYQTYQGVRKSQKSFKNDFAMMSLDALQF